MGGKKTLSIGHIACVNPNAKSCKQNFKMHISVTCIHRKKSRTVSHATKAEMGVKGGEVAFPENCASQRAPGRAAVKDADTWGLKAH